MNKKNKIFVLDTNVILHDATCIQHFGDNEVVINRDDIFLDAAIGNLQKDPLRYILLFIKKFLSYYFIDLKSNYPKYYKFFHIFRIFALSLLSLPGLVIFSKMKSVEIMNN